MYVVTDGKRKWVGEKQIRTGRGIVDPRNPPDWARVFPAWFIDRVEKMERGPQVMHPKDIGAIVAHTGLGSGWEVVEGGSGSGLLTAYLANIVKPGMVYSYELREEFLKIAERNIQKLGLKNVVFRRGSVFEFREEPDMVVFDLPNPWQGVERVRERLKEGGFFVCYLPTVNQVLRWIKETKDFIERRVIQVNEVEWRVKENALRPKSKTLAHTAFICIARKS